MLHIPEVEKSQEVFVFVAINFLYLSEILSAFVVNVVLDFRQHLNVQWSEPWQMSSRPWLQLSDQGQPSMS